MVHHHNDSKPNLTNEPNKPLVNSENSFETALQGGEIVAEHHRLGEDASQREVNEANVAIVDTACTSCIHSKKWREAFSRGLPRGSVCEMTPGSKTFHFANGQSSSGRLVVWRIPIFLGGQAGEIYSAEMPSGSTPLLLSISAMKALDAVIRVKASSFEMGSLSLTVPMVTTRAGHLAIRVDPNGAATQREPLSQDPDKPAITSSHGDLLIYYNFEGTLPLFSFLAGFAGGEDGERRAGRKAPTLQPRGVSTRDKIGELTTRRRSELGKAEGRQLRMDRCMWTALRRDFSVAEQFSTNNFQDTFVFEPWGTGAGLTRWSAEQHAWTNSQPLRELDGSDLYSRVGREACQRTLRGHRPFLVVLLLWGPSRVKLDEQGKGAQNEVAKFVLWLCRRQARQGRYYLLGLPAKGRPQERQRLEGDLKQEAGGKKVTGHLCAYGLARSSGAKPGRTATTWVSNSDILVNKLGKQCVCRVGEHSKDSQAEPTFPEGLCRAVCQGILETMVFDYSLAFATGGPDFYSHAYPVDEDTDMESSGGEIEEEPAEDDWRVEGEDRIVRVHRAPRRLLFIPYSSTAPPCEFTRIRPGRKTRMVLQDGARRERDDDWWDGRRVAMDFLWTGETEFRLGPVAPSRGPEQPAESPPEVRHQGVEGSAPMQDESAMPYDSAVPWEEEVPELDVLESGAEQPAESPPEVRHQGVPDRLDPLVMRRRGHRARQLQRGFWVETQEESVLTILEATLDYVRQEGGEQWNRIDLQSDLGKSWVAHESAQAEVKLVLCSTSARRMKKPQPHFGPLEVPLRKSYLLLDNNTALTTDFEAWGNLAPAAQVRPLVAQGRRIYVVVYGTELGEAEDEEAEDRWQIKEASRERQWVALPRELKLAIRRIHVNLGHANTKAMLRSLRIARASESAIKACRLFRCKECPRMHEPREPRPSKLPTIDEFNIQLGLDIITEKDAAGQSWSWLNILCQGTTFQVCALLGETVYNPTAKAVIQALSSHWLSWAGFPERGFVTDRARYFLSELADLISDHGCTFDSAAKASPWQIGQVERHGGLWKESFRRLAWSQQVSGLEEVTLATAAVAQAKNSTSRKGGFAPTQWVLGRDIRLPAALCDDAEVARIGAQAVAATPTTSFHRRTQLRMAAREAFAKASNSDALRRAELRQVRPTRGPFPVGAYVFYYDGADKAPSPNNWRGVARVVGHEGSGTVWLSHRGILIAVSPEQLSRAFDDEVESWITVGNELDLIDTTPAAGGTGYIDLRKAPKPPESYGEEKEKNEENLFDDDPGDQDLQRAREELQRLRREGDPSSTSSAQGRYESERDAKKARLSSAFFKAKEKERRAAREGGAATPAQEAATRSAETVPVPMDDDGDLEMPMESAPDWSPSYDPELDDYHTPAPPGHLPPVREAPEMEAVEREAKRQRVTETGDVAMYAFEKVDANLAAESNSYVRERARNHYLEKEASFLAAGVDLPTFLFGVSRNDFSERYSALAAGENNQGNAVKKKGRKEIKLQELPPELQVKFTQAGGADAREWDAWRAKEACDVLDLATSRQVREQKPSLIIPTRWVRTNKNDGLVGKEFLAKSRLVVQGFKDKSLGQYRRDAPTASAIAESVCLAVCTHLKFTLLAKDIKNAYFSGKDVGREIYLDQPKGGLPGLKPGQLLRANKAIYGFAEAARLFWLALKEHLESDGWKESRLEPALFYLRWRGRLVGILVTHVDDIEGGVHKDYMDKAFYHSAKALDFATNHFKDFVFRGREIRQGPEGHIDVTMRNYALSMKGVSISVPRRRQLTDELDPKELEVYQSSAGELGWVTRQLRCDLAFENGVAQRAKGEACVGDLVKLKQFIGMARRGADFRMRFWSDVDLTNATIVHLADSGHANGTPDHNEILRYRSVGGYFILAASPGLLEGETVRANILAYNSGQTKRVCRSTLAAEASHLAEAVESGGWITVLLEEALVGDLDLKNWPDILERRDRIYVTDARSVYDYLQKDSTSTSSDKRMAIEGALLRETVRKPRAHVRWIDGMQNIADVLTKATADKTVLKQFMRDGCLSLVQTEQNFQAKEKKRLERQSRKQVVKRESGKEARQQERKQAVAAEAQNILADEMD